MEPNFKKQFMRLRLNEKVSLGDRCGTNSNFEMNIRDFKVSAMDERQKKVASRLFETGNLAQLSKEERELIQDVKLQIGLALPFDIGETALIVRFDCKWVRIDGPKLPIDELTLPEFFEF